MLKQPPKTSTTKPDTPATSVTGKVSKKASKSLKPLTRAQVEHIVSDSAIKQQLDKLVKLGMLSPGDLPPQFQTRNEPTKIAADVVDAVKWQDTKNQELTNLKTQDINQDKPWLDELLEDFVAFDLSPTNTTEEVKAILKELNAELEALQESGYGPEARNYIHNLKRELELVVDKL